MKLRWLIPIAVLIPLRISAADTPVGARVATITINPREVTVLHLRPEFESTIRMPEEITSVILGSPGEFKAEHSEGEPEYVYVKPITKEPAQSNLLIATRSGQHVTLELVSDGDGVMNQSQPVDFLIEYRASRSFLIADDSPTPAMPSRPGKQPDHDPGAGEASSGFVPLSSLDEEFRQQQKIICAATGGHCPTQTASPGVNNSSDGKYPNLQGECGQAVDAAQSFNDPNSLTGTEVFTIAYGSPASSTGGGSSGNGGNCGTDVGTGQHSNITPCQTMQQMSSGWDATPQDQSYFYSDWNDAAQGGTGCKASGSNNAITDLNAIASDIVSRFTQSRLVPPDAP